MLCVDSKASLGTSASSNGVAGAVRYMAPELLFPGKFGLSRSIKTFASDVYAFACVCVEVNSFDLWYTCN